MSGGVDTMLQSVLAERLPGLFGGPAPAVRVALVSEQLVVDPQSADASAGLPAPDDRTDHFAFQRDQPDAIYTLTQPPYPGPRRVRLASAAGDTLSLRDDEVAWERADSRVFRLRPRATRDLADVSTVDVLYGVTAVYAKLKALRTLAYELTAADASKLEAAEALALAVLTLERSALIEAARASYADGSYTAAAEVKSLTLQRGERLPGGALRLTLAAELELKVGRALADDEGGPITHIRTPGVTADPTRPVDVRVDLDI